MQYFNYNVICSVYHFDREAYSRCMLVGSLGTSLYVPPSAYLLGTHWSADLSIEKGIAHIGNEIFAAVKDTAPYWLMLYASVGLTLAGLVFWLQQLFYTLLEADIAYTLHKRANREPFLPSSVIRALVKVCTSALLHAVFVL